ncbi:hypothetical protein HA402_006829 [Bradysia odoriphaga]|nr:hypothetical protein HA402_006829 [Bradysia odoriphaga]
MGTSTENHFTIQQCNKETVDIATYINYPIEFHIFDTKWLPSCPTKFVTVGATSKSSPRGFIQISELNNDRLDLVKMVDKKSAFRCATFGGTIRNSSSLSLGNFNGNLQIFDIERSDFPIYDVEAHDGIVNCVDGMGNGDGVEVVTGGQDGLVKVFDPRQGAPVVCISPVKKEDGGSGCRDCWSVTFTDGQMHSSRAVCAGYENGDIKVIDLRILKERYSHNVGSGVCKVGCERKYEETRRHVAGTVDGSIHLYDVNKNQHNHVRVAQSSSIWSVNYLPQQDNVFASVGDSIDIWRECDSSSSLPDSKNPIQLLAKIHLSPAGVNCFDWNPDFKGLGVCGSFDQKIRVLVTSGL